MSEFWKHHRWWLIAAVVAVVVAVVVVAVAAQQEPEQDTLTSSQITMTPGFNVKDYGAKGDGQANDEYAILKAIDAAKGRTVYFPAGNYLVNEGFEIGRAVVVKGSADPDDGSYLMVITQQTDGSVTWKFTWLRP